MRDQSFTRLICGDQYNTDAGGKKETNHNIKIFQLYSTLFELCLCPLCFILSSRTQFLSPYLWNSWHNCLHWKVVLRTDELDGNVKRQCLNGVCQKKTDVNINYAQVKLHTCSTETICSTYNKKHVLYLRRMLKMNDQ